MQPFHPPLQGVKYLEKRADFITLPNHLDKDKSIINCFIQTIFALAVNISYSNLMVKQFLENDVSRLKLDLPVIFLL